MKQLLTCLFLCSIALAKAQVVVNVQLPPAGISIKQQLWNLSLVNAFSEMIQVQVEMVMTEVSSGQRVLSGVSKIIPVAKGAKVIQANDAMPIVYNAGGGGYNIDANPDGFLPVGVFNVCYIITRVGEEVAERLAEECQVIEVEPISPPQLILPADSAFADASRPLFTWLPPTPYHLFNNLQYDWVLVEVQQFQTGADAIQQNVPLLAQRNLASASFQYPLSAPGLDTVKLYAWRVTAKTAAAPVANSEIWTFRLPGGPAPQHAALPAGQYIKLRRQEDASINLVTGVLQYEYGNEWNDSTVQLKLTDITQAAGKISPLRRIIKPCILARTCCSSIWKGCLAWSINISICWN